MKIISWNVNGIRAVEKKGFTDWLLSCDADVVCIQETKAHPSQLGQNLLAPGASQDDFFQIPEKTASSPVSICEKSAKYYSFWSSAKKAGYSSTAMYSKKQPDKVEILGTPEFDDEGRVLLAFLGKLVVISAYFPNSQDHGARLDYKLRFCDSIFKYLENLVAKEIGCKVRSVEQRVCSA